MKEKFLSRWSNWWSLTRGAKQLNEAFAKELNELIEREIALRQPPVISSVCDYKLHNHQVKVIGKCKKCDGTEMQTDL